MTDDILDYLINSSDENEREEEDKKIFPLLEEINMIEDEEIRGLVRSLLSKAYEFWMVPSSLAGTNPPDEMFPGGAVLHTQRVFRVLEVLMDSHDVSGEEADVLRGAALVHDITKMVPFVFADGHEEDTFDINHLYQDSMYPYTLGKFLILAQKEDERQSGEGSSSILLGTEKVSELLRLVRTHRGLFSPIPESIPLTTNEWLLHYADQVASRLHWIVDGEEIKIDRWVQETSSESGDNGSEDSVDD